MIVLPQTPSEKNFCQPHMLQQKAEILHSGGQSIRELVYKSSASALSGTAREEVVVTVQGFLLRCQLPPILNKRQ